MSKTSTELPPPFVRSLDIHGVSPLWVPERCPSVRLQETSESTKNCLPLWLLNEAGVSLDMYNCKGLLQKARSCELETYTRKFKNCARQHNKENKSAPNGDTEMKDLTFGPGHGVVVCPKQEISSGLPSHVDHDFRDLSFDIRAKVLWDTALSANGAKYEKTSAWGMSPNRSYSPSKHYGFCNDRVQGATTNSDSYLFNLTPTSGCQQEQEMREKPLVSFTESFKERVPNDTCNTRTTLGEHAPSGFVNESLFLLTDGDEALSNLGMHKIRKDLMIHSLMTCDEARTGHCEKQKSVVDGCAVSPTTLAMSDGMTAQNVSLADGNTSALVPEAPSSKCPADGSSLMCFPATSATDPLTAMKDSERGFQIQGNPSLRRPAIPSNMAFVAPYDQKSGYLGISPQTALSCLPNRIYKTKICVHNLRGRCARAGNCSFAHAPEELRERPNLFKTRLCVNFSTCGTCGMGSNCRFAHGEAELRQTPEAPVFLANFGIQQSNLAARNNSLPEDVGSSDDSLNLFTARTQRLEWESGSIRNFSALDQQHQQHQQHQRHQQQQCSCATDSLLPSFTQRHLVEGSLKDTSTFKGAEQQLDYKETSPTQASTGTPIENGLTDAPTQTPSKTLPLGSASRGGSCTDDTTFSHPACLSPGSGGFCQPQTPTFRGYCNITAPFTDAPPSRPLWTHSHTAKTPLSRQFLMCIHVPPTPAIGTTPREPADNSLSQNEQASATAVLWNGRSASMLSKSPSLALEQNALELNYPPVIHSALAALDIRQQLLVRELEVLNSKVIALHSERQRLLQQYGIKDLGSSSTMVLKDQAILPDLGVSGVLMGASTHASSGLHIHMRTAETSRMGSFETFPPPSVRGMSGRESTQGARPTPDGSTSAGNDDEHFIYSAIQNVVGPLDTPYYQDSGRWAMRNSNRRCALAAAEFDAQKTLAETRLDAVEKPAGHVSDMLSTGPAGPDSGIADFIAKPFGSDVLLSVAGPKETVTCSPLIPLNTSYNRAFGAPPRMGRRSTFSNTGSSLWEGGRYISNAPELPSILSGSRRILNANSTSESTVLGACFAVEKKHDTVVGERQLYSRKYSLGHHDLFGAVSQRSTFCSQYPVYPQENGKQIHQITTPKDSEGSGDKNVVN